MRLSTKLILAITTLLLLISTLVTWYVGTEIENRFKGVVSAQQFALTTQVAGELDRMVADRQLIIGSAGRDIAQTLRAGRQPAADILSTSSLMYWHFPMGVYLIDERGNIQMQTTKHPRLAAEAAFRATVELALRTGKEQLSQPYLPPGRNLDDEPRIVFAHPIKNAEGGVIRVLVGVINSLSPDFTGVIRQLQIGDTGYAYLFTSERLLMVHPDPERMWLQDIPPGANPMIDRAIKGFEGADTAINSRGISMLVGTTRLRNADWILAVNYPLSEAYAPITAMRANALTATLLGTLLTIGIVGYLLQRSTKPLLDLTERISNSASAAADLRLAHVPASTSSIAAGALARAYNRLIDRIQSEQALQRETRLQLEEKEAFLRKITDTMGEGVFVRDRHGLISFVNQQACQMLGYEAEDMMGRESHALFHHHYPDGQLYPRSECLLDQAAASGKAHFLEDFFWRRDGGLMQVSLNIAPIHKDGRLVGSVTSFRDITERQRIRNALKESEERQSRIISLISDWVWEIDANGVYTYASARIVDLLGYTQQEMLGKTPFDLMPAAEAMRVNQLFESIVAEKRSFAFLENINLHKNGSVVVLETSGTPMFDKDGNYRGYRGIDRNITERKQVEQALIKARDEADASARVKSEFLANMSHEIRTPMNGIMGMTELVLETPLTPEQRENLELVYSSAQNLLTLLNDVLDLSKIEAGKLTLETVPMDLRQILADTLRTLSLRATQKGLRLSLHLDDAIPLNLRGDPARLRQIMVNLVSNAIKFTATGEIEVSVALKSSQAGHVQLRFAVRDTGIGIPADKQSSIFDAFVQADSSVNREYGGTGLGLSICNTLVHLMHGRIWLESEPGRGSTFYFSARFELDQPSPAPLASGSARAPAALLEKSLSVLLAEDNPVNQKFALSVLGKAGHRVSLAHNGQEAVNLALSDDFDLILMDIQMPVLDGFAATRQIRQHGITTPVIALTAHALEGFREQCLAAGMNDYLSKPVQVGELLGKLNQLGGGCFVMPSTASPDEPVAEVVLDRQAALRLTDGDLEMLRTMAGMVATQIQEDLPYLRQYCDARDGVKLRQAAHRLKGSLASVGAQAAHAACLELEKLGKEDASPRYDAGLACLEQELARLSPELHRLAIQSD